MPYILHVGVILACCLIFYKLLLQKETFYQLNRYVLLACLVLSFSLPLLPVPQQFSLRKTEEPVVINTIESAAANNVAVQHLPQDHAVPGNEVSGESSIGFNDVMTWMTWLYWFGVAAFGITFLVQVFTILVRVYTYPVIKDGRFTIVELPGDKAPCSFGNLIFINPEKYDWDIYNQILLHEKLHIEYKHSMDILLAEIVLIFQWFNPFAWLYRKELENNLEFLTDELMLTKGKVDRTSYQMNLLKVSAPHFPLSVTTNYNQSLLKKRVIMMTAKRSNINTTWKYLFLLPVLVISVCVLNKPVASAQQPAAKTKANKENQYHNHEMKTEGVWFATLKGEKVSIEFKNEGDDGENNNSSTFALSDFKDLPKDKQGTFTLTRDPGTMQFTGKFEGDQGMGKYKFVADKSFADYLHKQGVDADDVKDEMVFFLVDVNRNMVQMLQNNGYTKFNKNDLIPLAALKVNEAYIKSLKAAGLNNVSLRDLIPLKSLNVTGDYVQEIKKAGYTNLTAERLITFKATGIDGKYLGDIRNATGKGDKAERDDKSMEKKEAPEPAEKAEKAGREEKDNNDDIDDIIAIKALNIDAAYIRSLKEVGYDNIDKSDLMAMKVQGITADYIQNLQKSGYKNIKPFDLIAIKTQSITPDYIKSFQNVGYTNLPIEEFLSLKALGVTAAFVKGFQDIGYKITPEDAVGLKVQGITPNLVQQYKEFGFANLSINDVVSAKATGTTPSFISSMKQKGHNLKSLDKYVQLKVVTE